MVLDPVLASGRGDQFADEEMIEAMIGLLLPQTTLLTPNSLEARRLAQQIGEGAEYGHHEPDLAECAHRLIKAGCEYVLLTGTHEGDAAGDQYPLRQSRRGAHRSMGALAGQLSRFGLHPGLGHCGALCQRV